MSYLLSDTKSIGTFQDLPSIKGHQYQEWKIDAIFYILTIFIIRKVIKYHFTTIVIQYSKFKTVRHFRTVTYMIYLVKNNSNIYELLIFNQSETQLSFWWDAKVWRFTIFELVWALLGEIWYKHVMTWTNGLKSILIILNSNSSMGS